MPDESPVENEQDQAPEAAEPEQPEAEEKDSSSDLSDFPDEAREYIERREKEMQADYTRKTQALAEERKAAQQAQTIVNAASNPNHPDHEQALAILGLEVGDDDDDEYVDEEDALRADVEALKDAYLAEQERSEQQAFQDAEDDFVSERIEALEEKEGLEFSDEELQLLYDAALSNRKDDGEPDVDGAYGLLKRVYDTRQKEWVHSKQTPRQPGSGRAASRKLNLDNREERISYAAEVAAGAINSPE